MGTCHFLDFQTSLQFPKSPLHARNGYHLGHNKLIYFSDEFEIIYTCCLFDTFC